MRDNTSWIPSTIEDLIRFSRMNSLPQLRLALDAALEAYFEEEREIAARKQASKIAN